MQLKILFLSISTKFLFFFDVCGDYTLHFKGERSIEILSHQKSKTRFTLMPAICSNGHSLSPLFIFIYKYAKSGERAFPKKYEYLQNLTRPYMVRFTEAGFSKDSILVEYIDKVLLRYQESLGKKICIILDKAPSHMSPTLKDHLDKKAIHYLFIPSGSTHLLQPLDVAVNKTIKQKVRNLYVEWLGKLGGKGKEKLVSFLSPPSVEDLLGWCTKNLDLLEPTLVTKAFEVTGILGSLQSLFDKNLLSQKLTQIVDDFITHRDTTLDESDYYQDSGDIEIEEIIQSQELYLEEDVE